MTIAAGQRILASDMLVGHNASGTHLNATAWFEPVVPSAGGAARAEEGNWTGVLCNANTEYVHWSIRVPDDFNPAVAPTVYVVLIPDGTGDLDWTCNTSAGTCGEDENANSDTATVDNLAVTDDRLTCVNVSAAFNGLSLDGGDFIGVKFIVDVLDAPPNSALVIGLVFTYSRDQ